MIVSIHQPNYMPWLGYFYKIHQADTFVLLDDVQFSNEGMHNYHYIKTPQGLFRLKVPVNYQTGDAIQSVTVRDELNWREKHLRTIEMNYKKAPFFEEVYSDISNLLTNDIHTNLADLNIKIIEFICQKLKIETKFLRASSLSIKESKEAKVIRICSEVGAKVYYSGKGAKAYQNELNFSNEGIELKYSEFQPLAYPQLWGEFTSNVFIFDYLMNCGYDWDRVLEAQAYCL